jgi:dihydrolipoamide dehydrogenase
VDRSASLGGTCLNIGCIPSKALLESSELYYQARTTFERHGIRSTGLTLDVGQMLRRKDEIIKKLSEGVAFLFKKNKIAFHLGTARLAPGMKVIVQGDGAARELEGAALLLATGSEPVALPALPFDGRRIVSSTETLCFEQAPAHLVVVGGGYIGLELGSVWARLGSKVTVVEFLPHILAPSDRELAGVLQRLLIKQGLTFHLDSRVTGAAVQGDKVTVRAEHQGTTLTLEADRVLVAVGRRPSSASLGLAQAGVTVEERTGRVPVNEHFETNVPGVYAIGDLIAGPMLAHKASEEGLAVAEHLAGQRPRVNYNTIPSVIYTAPELASVGLTEEQVKETGKPYRVGRAPFSANGRARCLGETDGLVKVLADQRADRLLGVHILGPRASELIAEAVLAMNYSGSAEDIALSCHAHPTLSEAVAEAARAARG